jgi:hypothetical protein
VIREVWVRLLVRFGVLLCCRKSANTKASMLYWVCGDQGLDSVFSSKDWLMSLR